MTLPMHDHQYLEDVSKDQLAALLLELASQLHVERQHRMALTAALQRKGVLGIAEVEALADDPDLVEAVRGALDQNLRRLLRIMTEAGNPRGPLRAEAA